MNWRLPLALLAFSLPVRVQADTQTFPQTIPSQVCRQAISAAERAHGIPSHLLAAIARVESGRKDQTSGTFNPWPWTVNVDGQGSFYDVKAQAVAAAIAMRPRVTRSIDVGCMQISLTHHADAFASLDQAFDPMANADYGARFLLQLFAKTQSWPRAVELYHSATPELGLDYRLKVYAAWPEERKLAEAQAPAPLASAWASTVNRSLLTAPLRQSAPRIQPRMPSMGGEIPPGRTLEAYRASPVRMALRAAP
ncbi:MAG TPA: hypothetical protein DDZ81_10730 [Acetobacteraceae bacterium]|jgi:hypothetical protein|nr:hypothetical protein [Acetobacteraceae bacterium]